MKKLVIEIIKIYRQCISPLFNPSCKFEPTCSQYMIDSISKKGVIKGIAIGTWRLIRCNPFSKPGYDPVK